MDWNPLGQRGERLCLSAQAKEEIGRHRDPAQDDYPNASGEEVVVVQEPVPWVPGNIVAEQELEGDRHREPKQADGDGLRRGRGPPDAHDEPDIDAKQDDRGECGDLVGLQFTEVFPIPGLTQPPVGDRDRDHRKPGEDIFPRGDQNPRVVTHYAGRPVCLMRVTAH